MYKIFFENSQGIEREIGKSETEELGFNIISAFLKEHNYKSYYYNCHYMEDKGLWVDVGSHTEFFYIRKEKNE